MKVISTKCSQELERLFCKWSFDTCYTVEMHLSNYALLRVMIAGWPNYFYKCSEIEMNHWYMLWQKYVQVTFYITKHVQPYYMLDICLLPVKVITPPKKILSPKPTNLLVYHPDCHVYFWWLLELPKWFKWGYA